jgi:hypothetical protein
MVFSTGFDFHYGFHGKKLQGIFFILFCRAALRNLALALAGQLG